MASSLLRLSAPLCMALLCWRAAPAQAENRPTQGLTVSAHAGLGATGYRTVSGLSVGAGLQVGYVVAPGIVVETNTQVVRAGNFTLFCSHDCFDEGDVTGGLLGYVGVGARYHGVSGGHLRLGAGAVGMRERREAAASTTAASAPAVQVGVGWSWWIGEHFGLGYAVNTVFPLGLPGEAFLLTSGLRLDFD